jgi:hypothetical protein
LWWPFWKWRLVEIFRCRESISVIIIYLHMKFRWNRTMLNLCGIVAAILKMATGKNCSMSGKLTSMSMPLFNHTSVTEFFRWSWHQCHCLYLSYICYRVLQMKLTSISMPLFIIHLSSEELCYRCMIKNGNWHLMSASSEELCNRCMIN